MSFENITVDMHRGHLRPNGVRSRYSRLHFLMIGLFFVAAVSTFNYWNLSSQYDDLVKKMAELQEVVRTSTMKREQVEKYAEDVKKRLRDAEDDLGKTKLAMDANKIKLAKALKQMQDNTEVDQLKTQLKHSQLAIMKTKNGSLEEISTLQSQLKTVIQDSNLQSERNSILQATIDSLRKELSIVPSFNYKLPPIHQSPGAKTADDVPGQLKMIPLEKVHIWNEGMTGISVHPGGPMVFVPGLPPTA